MLLRFLLILFLARLCCFSQGNSLLAHKVIDSGGSLASSSNYTMAATIGGFGGLSSAVSAGYQFRHGYAGELNEAPITTQKVLARGQSSSAKMTIAELLLNDLDPEGDALFISTISTLSTNGVPIDSDLIWVTYKAGAGGPFNDEFAYIVRDALGDSSRGSIMVSASPIINIPNQNLLRIENLPSSERRLWFLGIPGRIYHIQATATLINPSWQTIGSAMAQPNGIYSFLDPEAENFPTRFYRGIRP